MVVQAAADVDAAGQRRDHQARDAEAPEAVAVAGRGVRGPGHRQRLVAQLIAQHTGQDLEQIEKDSDRDRWFTAPEAKEYGFVDHVVKGAPPSDSWRRGSDSG